MKLYPWRDRITANLKKADFAPMSELYEMPPIDDEETESE